MFEDSSNVNEFNQEFYNPLCLSGYLTPLQRKKLREKRIFECDEVESVTTPVRVKKMRGIKRKKEHLTNVSSKTYMKMNRSKVRIPQIKYYAAAKIICRTIDEDKAEKKFFKTSSHNRLEKAFFAMPLVLNKNSLLNVDNGVKKILPCSKNEACISPNNKENFYENCESVLQSDVSEEKDNCNMNEQNKTGFLEQVSISTEKELLFDFDWPSDELLLKRQMKARADQKLKCLKEPDESIKKMDNLNETEVSVQPMKFYPIFHTAIKKEARRIQQTKSSPKNGTKKKLDSSQKGEQMIIDAGQKEIGAKICSTCNMIYTPDQEEDKILHLNFHNMYLINLKFPGWKEENVIGEYADGRVIKVTKDDKTFKLKKIEDILQVANRDLGFPSSALPNKPDLTFILFISNTKQVVGFVLAEPISTAFQVLSADSESVLKRHFTEQKATPWRIGNWYSSSEIVSAVCGINRVWVNHSFRRCKVASRMIDCLRCNFIHGHVVGIRELAYTDPSVDGRAFAAAYTGTDNFLVYR